MKITNATRTLTDKEAQTLENLKNGGQALADLVVMSTPAGRRQSLALTHLETAMMYAVKAATAGDE